MFKVQIFKNIWAGDLPKEEGIRANLKFVDFSYPECVALQYDIELSFPPFIGLSILDETEAYCFRSGDINKVMWFHKKTMFGCWVNDEFPYTLKGYDYSYNYLIDRALKDGWKVIKQ